MNEITNENFFTRLPEILDGLKNAEIIGTFMSYKVENLKESFFIFLSKAIDCEFSGLEFNSTEGPR